MTERNVAREETLREIRRRNDITFEVAPEIYYEEGYNGFLPDEEDYSEQTPPRKTKTNQTNQSNDPPKTITKNRT